MTRDSESNNKERFIVLVVVSVNATVSVLLIAAMVYSFTLITQQRHEITNLQTLLHKFKTMELQNEQHNNGAEDKVKSFQHAILSKSKVSLGESIVLS